LIARPLLGTMIPVNRNDICGIRQLPRSGLVQQGLEQGLAPYGAQGAPSGEG